MLVLILPMIMLLISWWCVFDPETTGAAVLIGS